MPDIPQTRRKLREAEYFLRKVRRLGRSPGSVREEFWYELSAFLSAARSVTFVLQAEAKDEYDTWFKPWKAGLDEPDRVLLEVLNDQRVLEVHRTGAAMVSEVRYFGMNQLVLDQPRHPAHRHYVAAPPGVPEPQVGIVEHHFWVGDAMASVVDTCATYWRLLARGVDDFSSQFPSA